MWHAKNSGKNRWLQQSQWDKKVYKLITDINKKILPKLLKHKKLNGSKNKNKSLTKEWN